MKKDFKPDDIIEYAGDKFKILKNNGESGRVQEYPNGDIVEPFYWKFEGEECVLIASKEIEVERCHDCGFHNDLELTTYYCAVENLKIPEQFVDTGSGDQENNFPEWCPLKSGPIIVRLKT